MTRAWQADVFMLGLFTESQCEHREVSAKSVGNIVYQMNINVDCSLQPGFPVDFPTRLPM